MASALTKKKTTGAVLIEAVVSVVILAVSVTVLIESLAAAYKATVINAQYAQALILLENQMSLMTRTPFLERDITSPRRFPPPHDVYEVTEEVANSELDPSSQMQEVRLSLKWKTGRRENNITVVTCLLNPPDEKF